MKNTIHNWTIDQLESQAGKTVLITGGNSGIGLETAKILAKAGANVIIGCRNPDKAKVAQTEIQNHATGKVDVVIIDVSDLESVRQAAAKVRDRCSKLDVLVNCAGIMQVPKRELTADGFEQQLGTNHLGHFLLAGLLFDLIDKDHGRIVAVSSIAHKTGKINFDDLMAVKKYGATSAYAQSKLANLLFALELDRKLVQSGSKVASICAHPGVSFTNLQVSNPSKIWQCTYKMISKLMQTPAQGAVPIVLAAAGKEAISGGYYGPRKLAESTGPVGDAKIAKVARNKETWSKLWQESETLVDFQWSI